jgi:hypothetical protein
MRKLLLGALLTATVMPAAAMEHLNTATEVEKLPFMKAYSYALAAEEYCFADLPDEMMNQLNSAAFGQDILIGSLTGDGESVSRRRPMDERAAAHLKGDQSACGPAIAFVRRTAAEAVSAVPELDAAIVAHAQKVMADDAAEKAAKEKAETEEQALAKFDDCKAIASDARRVLDAGVPIGKSELPGKLEGCLKIVPADNDVHNSVDSALNEFKARIAAEEK